MATMTIRIPDSVKETMDSYDEINWSAVARKSLIDKIQEEKVKQALYESAEDIQKNRIIPHTELVRTMNEKIQSHVDETSKY